MAFQDFLIGALVLLIGALFCFVGYRFFRILIAIWGFFAGFNLGTAAMTALFSNAFLQTTTGIVLGLVLGLVWYLLGGVQVPMFGPQPLAADGFLLGQEVIVHRQAVAGELGEDLFQLLDLVQLVILLEAPRPVLAVVFAFLILILNLPKLLIMVFTALGGAVAMLAGLLILLGQAKVAYLQYGDAVALVRASWFWSIIAIALAVVGFLVQWRTMQEYTLEWTEPSTTQVQ